MRPDKTLHKVRSALERGDSLTALEAWERFGVLHLASSIRRLREMGCAINSERIKTASGKHIARYSMAGHEGGPG